VRIIMMVEISDGETESFWSQFEKMVEDSKVEGFFSLCQNGNSLAHELPPHMSHEKSLAQAISAMEQDFLCDSNEHVRTERTGEEHLSLAYQEEARQAWYENTYGPDGGEFDDRDDYDPREDDDLDEEVDSGDLSDSMNKICDKYEDVFKRLSETDSKENPHKEGAD